LPLPILLEGRAAASNAELLAKREMPMPWLQNVVAKVEA